MGFDAGVWLRTYHLSIADRDAHQALAQAGDVPLVCSESLSHQDVDFHARAFAFEVTNYVEQLEAVAIEELIEHEAQRRAHPEALQLYPAACHSSPGMRLLRDYHEINKNP